MSRAHAFEDLKVWQLARELVRSVYRLTRDVQFGSDQGLRDQIRRAAVSCMANIAEGFERGSNKEFIRFLFMARGSAGEVRSHLYVAGDLGYLNQPDFDRVQRQTLEVSGAVFRFIRYLESRKVEIS